MGITASSKNYLKVKDNDFSWLPNVREQDDYMEEVLESHGLKISGTQ